MTIKNNLAEELLFAMLPAGLEEWFEIEKYEKKDKIFRIYLVEKNIPPPLPDHLRGKRIINTLLAKSIVDDYPIRGRKGELVVKRRSWKIEGERKLLKRDINLCKNGTRLAKEFAGFLKVQDRNNTGAS